MLGWWFSAGACYDALDDLEGNSGYRVENGSKVWGERGRESWWNSTAEMTDGTLQETDWSKRAASGLRHLEVEETELGDGVALMADAVRVAGGGG